MIVYRKYEFDDESDAKVFCNEIIERGDDSTAIPLGYAPNGNYKVDALIEGQLEGYEPYEVWPHPENVMHYIFGSIDLYLKDYNERYA